MSGVGTTISMIKTLKSNSQLLNRNNLLTQLKSINNRTKQEYKHQPISKEALTLLRLEERNELNSNVLKKRVVGVLVIIPVVVILLVVVYLLVQSL